jgi:hypothetical protein
MYIFNFKNKNAFFICDCLNYENLKKVKIKFYSPLTFDIKRLKNNLLFLFYIKKNFYLKNYLLFIKI